MLLAALVVLWFVVLVPMVVTRGDVQDDRTARADSGRTLQRRRTTTAVVSAETERVTIDREALLSTGELRVDVHALRRRTLGGLVALAVVALVGALVYSPWLWTAQVVLDLAVVGYVLVLRKVARRERLAARRAARTAAREALRTASRPVAEPRTAAPAPRTAPEQREAVVETAPPSLPHPSVPLAPVAQFRGRVVAARTPAPVGWQNSAVVGLDDDDLGFADIDEYRPRRVANL